MIVNEKRRAKINKFTPCCVSRLSKSLKSMTMQLCDPDKITTSPEEVVNRMDNMNRMQRLSVGVYMYDSAAALANRKEQKDSVPLSEERYSGDNNDNHHTEKSEESDNQ